MFQMPRDNVKRFSFGTRARTRYLLTVIRLALSNRRHGGNWRAENYTQKLSNVFSGLKTIISAVSSSSRPGAPPFGGYRDRCHWQAPSR